MNIYISIFEMDEEYDVEVYEWIDETQLKGNLIKSLTDYGFSSRHDAITYIEQLKKQHHIVDVVDYEEEVKESTSITLPLIKPNYYTYVFTLDELMVLLKKWFLKSFQYPVPFLFPTDLEDEESLFVIYIQYDKMPDWVSTILASHFDFELDNRIDITDLVLSKLLNQTVEETVYHPYNDQLYIHTLIS